MQYLVEYMEANDSMPASAWVVWSREDENDYWHPDGEFDTEEQANSFLEELRQTR